ncbi:MAG: DUF1186 domain-containing protein [Lachnospiraceae bacterium]
MEVKDQVKKAIADITYETKEFPEEAFQIISENPADATADLMNALAFAIEERDEIEEGYMLHFYAAYLLAQFEFKPAFPLLLEMSSLPGEVLDILIGDTVTEGLRDILYSTYNGDWEAVRDYLIYEDCYDYAKCAALDLAVQLYLDGALEKQELTGLFEKLIYHPEVCDDVYFDTRIAGSICQCHFIEIFLISGICMKRAGLMCRFLVIMTALSIICLNIVTKPYVRRLEMLQIDCGNGQCLNRIRSSILIKKPMKNY